MRTINTRRSRFRLAAGLATSAALLASAGVAGATTPGTDGAGEAPAAEAGALPAPSSGWTVNTDDCVDPDAANAKIEGEIKIGSIMPLSGTPATAFAPVKDGLTEYMNYANEKGLLGDLKISLTIEDDQYKPENTPGAATKLLDGGVQVVVGAIGTPNNAAIRQTMNDNCIPQLMALTGAPEWGQVAEYPWTTGGLVPYDIEAKIYAGQIAADFPDGATAALFTVSSEFGQVYAEGFKAAAAERNITIVDEQTIGAEDLNPPTAQLTSIAEKKPTVIMAVPLGLGCVTFLNELGKKRAEYPELATVPTYITNTCASPKILAAAGANADGLITSQAVKNPLDPQYASDPTIKEYVDIMTAKGLVDSIPTGVVGWAAGEALIHIIQEAAKSPEGVTRASIMNATRSMYFDSAFSFDGIVNRLDGEVDAFQLQSLQVLKFHAADGTFENLGPVNSEYETK